MSKIAKSIAGIALSLVLVGTGVWAALSGNVDLGFGGKINFTKETYYADVKIDAKVEHGGYTIDEFTYDSLDPLAVDPSTDGWEVKAITLTQLYNEITYTFTFENKGEKDLTINIAVPALDGNLTGLVTLDGGLVSDTNGGDDTIVLGVGAEAVFEYTLSLNVFTTNIVSEDIEFGIDVAFTPDP